MNIHVPILLKTIISLFKNFDYRHKISSVISSLRLCFKAKQYNLVKKMFVNVKDQSFDVKMST